MKSLRQLFEFISLSNTGYAIVDSIKKTLRAREMNLIPLSGALLEQRTPYAARAGAFMEIHPDQIQIYYLYDQPLGLLAPLLTHEFVHCLDQEFQALPPEGLREQAYRRFQRRSLYQAEIRAYALQFQITKEIWSRIPEYFQALKAWEKGGYILTRNVTIREIIRNYRELI